MGLDLNDVSQFFLKVNENVPLSDVILTKEQEQSIHQFLRSAKNRTELRKYKIKATNTILLYGSAGGGKGTTLETKIYTPDGYKLMKDIKVGDIIFDGAGKPTKVLGVYPQGIKKCYDICFSDRTKITVDEDHLTQFYQTKVLHKKKVKGKVISKEWGKKYQVLDTKALIEYFNKEKEKVHPTPLRLDLPVLNYKHKKVDLDPYWLGLFLGDGCNRKYGIIFSNTEEDIKNYFLKYCKQNKCDYKEMSKENNFNITYADKILNKIKKYNLQNTKAENKFIPKEYVYNNFETRLAIVRGLMDTDGYVGIKKSKKGYIGCSYEYTTVSKQLSDDFAFLVRSLGCVDTVVEKQGAYKKNGEKHICQKYYRHSIKVPNGLKIVSSEKHLAKVKNKQLDEPVRKIIAIKRAKDQKTQCIYVESKTHLYIIDNVTPTHNTYSTKAIATELGMPLYVLNVAGVLEGANPLKNIQDVFDFVRDKKNQPCILFMDECDSIVMSRNRNDIEPQMLRATNVVLQTINEENEDLNSDLTIFSATNLVHKIDEAFKSRFGLQLEFPMPQDYGEQTKMLMNGKKEFEFFNLIDDTDPNDMRIINKRAREKEFSTRELKKKILEECEELALKNIESGKPIQKLDIKLSNIMKRVARHIHSGISERLKSVDKEED